MCGIGINDLGAEAASTYRRVGERIDPPSAVVCVSQRSSARRARVRPPRLQDSVRNGRPLGEWDVDPRANVERRGQAQRAPRHHPPVPLARARIQTAHPGSYSSASATTCPGDRTSSPGGGELSRAPNPPTAERPVRTSCLTQGGS